jgi:hypothetical protein
MPSDLKLVTPDYITKALMPAVDVGSLLTTFDILGTCCINTLMLDESEATGLLNPRTTITAAFQTEYDRFKKKLEQLEKEEREHNAATKQHYPYLYPSRVAHSIAI